MVVEENVRSIISPQEIDIWLPEYKIGIEFNGLIFHREGLIEGFGSPKGKKYHVNKTSLMESLGYRLIHIFEDEWLYKKSIIKSKLLQILNKQDTIKINARDCEIKELSFNQIKKFLNLNHIQGTDITKHRYGLFFNDELVAVMTFLNQKEGWNLNRYCAKIGYSVRGGASKLLKHFCRLENPKKIITFADRRFSIKENNLYEKLGFKFAYFTNPNYFYVKNNGEQIRHSRLQFQKHKLSKIFENVDFSKSEKQIMSENGYDRIWDCGHLKYEYEIRS